MAAEAAQGVDGGIDIDPFAVNLDALVAFDQPPAKGILSLIADEQDGRFRLRQVIA